MNPGTELPYLSEKETKILESAVKIFSSKGFSAATTKEISQESGIAEGTLFKYFKTKKDILRGVLVLTIRKFGGKIVLESVEKTLSSPKISDRPPESIIKELLVDRLKLIESAFPMIRVIATEAMYHSDVREAIHESIVNPAIASFEVFYNNMAEQGYMRKDIDYKAALRSILGNIFMLIMQSRFLGDKLTDEEIDKTTQIIISGIGLKYG